MAAPDRLERLDREMWIVNKFAGYPGDWSLSFATNNAVAA